ncbi:MAG: NAD-dependent epimerase/dehydratase family protein [Alphaproteobacteria bacterium]|nr:NAD-dependent epimerase/dehydratase family protein [Alphaproteobacteria bacterium]
MKVLIIGGTGTLSSPIVDECIRLDYDVTMINRGKRNRFINPKAELIKCDINDEEALKDILKDRGFDCCIDFLVFNEQQLQRSLRIFTESCHTDQYIFISSAQVYNTSIKGVKEEDSSELIQPLWSYSINKARCEQLLKDYCDTKKINYTIIRPGVTYGDTRIPYGMDPIRGKHWTIIERIKAGKPIITWNNGENKLNLTHVDDFAKGAVGLIGNEAAYNEAFNIVGDYVYSWKEVLNTIGKIIGREVKTVDIPVDFYALELNEYVRGRLKGGRALDLCCSNAKLKRVMTDFKTTITLEDGIKRTLLFYINNNYCNGFDYIWDAECDRILSQYNSSSNEHKTQLHYIQYNKTSLKESISNRCDYYIEFYKGSIKGRLLKKLESYL